MAPRIKVHDTENTTDTPSQNVVKAALTIEGVVQDRKGRSIRVRKLKVLERIAMLKLIGKGNGDNMLYVVSVMPAFYVTSIDDNPVSKPQTEDQLIGLLQRLDDEGLEAIGEWIAQNDKQPEQEDKDDLKNS